MKTIARLVLLLLPLCLAAQTAFGGSYDRRPNEMKAAIEKSLLPPDAKKIALRNIEVYRKAREKLLLSLAKPFESEQVKKDKIWAALVSPGFALPGKLAEKVPSDLESPPGKAGLATLRALIEEENAFWKKLASHDLATFAREIIRTGEGLEERTKSLESKWKKLKDDVDDDLDEAIEDMKAEILADFKKVDQELEKAIKSVDTKTLQLLDNLGTLLGSMPPVAELQILAQTLGLSSHLIRAHLHRRLQGLRKRITAIVQSEDAVVLAFLRIHEDTADFLEENGIGQAELAAGAQSARATGLCSGLKAGQKEDCEALVKVVKGHTEKHLKTAKDINNRFYERNEGRFFGDISDKTVEDLLEIDATEDWAEDAEDYYEEVGKAIRSRLDGYYRRPFWDKAPPEVRSQVKSYFESAWKDTAKAYAKAHDLHYREEWIDQILRIKKRNAEKLD